MFTYFEGHAHMCNCICICIYIYVYVDSLVNFYVHMHTRICIHTSVHAHQCLYRMLGFDVAVPILNMATERQLHHCRLELSWFNRIAQDPDPFPGAPDRSS